MVNKYNLDCYKKVKKTKKTKKQKKQKKESRAGGRGQHRAYIRDNL